MDRQLKRMPAPSPLAREVLTKDLLDAGRTVLPEDAYSEALGAVIERDFYPDLPRLQQQLAWLQALESGDEDRIEEAQAALSESVRRQDRLALPPTPAHRVPEGAGGVLYHNTAVGRGQEDADGAASAVASWSAELQQHDGRSTAGRGGGGGVVASFQSSVTGAAVLDSLGVDAFQRTFVNEDSATFAANMAAAAAERARKTWWTRLHTGSARWQQLLADRNGRAVAGAAGDLLLRDENAHGVELLDDVSGGVDTHGRVRTWRYRPRNALFFPPSLAVSNDISGVTATRPNPDLPAALLRDGFARGVTGQLGPGPAQSLALLREAASAEGKGAPALLLRDDRMDGGARADAAPRRALKDGEYSADDLDTGRYGGRVGRAFGGTAGALDLALPSCLLSRPRIKADGGVVHPAALDHARTRMGSRMLLSALEVVGPAPVPFRSGGSAAALLLSLPQFRGYTLIPTPRIVAGGFGALPNLGGDSEVITLEPPLTWGAIAGLPTVLDPLPSRDLRTASFAYLASSFGLTGSASLQAASGGPSFRLPPRSTEGEVRDALLDTLRGRKRAREEGRQAASVREVLRAAVATGRESVLGGASAARTPVWAAAGTPSLLGGGAAGARSTVSAATGVSRGSGVRAAIAGLTPAARRLAATVASQVAASRGSRGVGNGGDLSGAFRYQATRTATHR
jgi:hypothetical protein